MAPRWTDSTDKHRVPRSEQIYVLLNPSYQAELPDQVAEGQIVLFIGFASEHSVREIEVLVQTYPGTGREAVVFHAMELGPKFRRFREEHPDDE